MSSPHEAEKPAATSFDRPADTGFGSARDDLRYHTGRVHITARQRGADLTALACLVLYVPHALASLAVVFAASYIVDVLSGPPWWVPVGCWTVSGALVFHRPCERILARRVFGLRHPAPQEAETLRAVWREVAVRAGIDGSAYDLWVEDSHDINAMTTAGHIVGVTSHALRALTPARLAGVLAHELGHHARGHTWASLLAFWYALPGRLVWRLLRRLATRVERLPTGAAILTGGLLCVALVALATATYGLIFLPLATPYLAAAVSRRSELRADAHAAGLGFETELVAVLSEEHEWADRRQPARAKPGTLPVNESIFTRLLAEHPDVHTRLHHLRKRMENRR
ncbi:MULTISPECIES: M48 family metalloprotease [Streptomyces]|uniref:M48 family metalloprotease n=1 Tax=Streptomyces eurythermus TaxID=42237 RepID=A0ABW6YXW0_9ACTN|nr:M48 family metalloprotease [Streptomyces sp. DSM 40868]